MACKCSNCRRDSVLYGNIEQTCDCCTSPLTKNSQFRVVNDTELVCEGCITEHYTTCKSCNTSQNKKKFTEVVMSFTRPRNPNDANVIEKLVPQKGIVCKSCVDNNYKKCGHCGTLTERRQMRANGENMVCLVCFEESYKICEVCNQAFLKTERTHLIGGRVACHNCYRLHGPIGGYESKVAMNFHGSGPYWLGVELEVEIANQDKYARGETAAKVIELLTAYDNELKAKGIKPSVKPTDQQPQTTQRGRRQPVDGEFVITKHDGSLSCGFEICTQPATLSEHIKRWDRFFDNVPNNLASYNTENCGLHVHVSRKSLTLLTIAKILVFLNESKNTEFVETMAGRRQNKYCVIAPKTYGVVKYQATQRREALNLTNNGTIEFRIFKGTLKRESFYKALEFVDATVQFCMSGQNSIKDCRDKQKFIDYVGLRSKDYPHLYAFICAKILKKETKLTKQFGFTIPNSHDNTDKQK